MSNYPLSSSHLEKEGRYLSSLYIEFKMADGGKESETRNTTLDHRKSTEKTKIKYVSCDKILHDSRSLESLPPSAILNIEKTLRTRLFHFLRDFIKMRVTEERVTCKNFFFFQEMFASALSFMAKVSQSALKSWLQQKWPPIQMTVALGSPTCH